jgi:hypothetical protein
MSDEEEGGGVIIIGTEEAMAQLIKDLGDKASKYKLKVKPKKDKDCEK